MDLEFIRYFHGAARIARRAVGERQHPEAGSAVEFPDGKHDRARTVFRAIVTPFCSFASPKTGETKD